MTSFKSAAFVVKNLIGETPLGQSGADQPYNFTVETGTIGVIFGGKTASSLLRLLIGLGEVQSGDVMVGNESIFKSAQTSTGAALKVRQKIGFAFRDKGLISNLSIRENVDLPAKYHGYYKSGPHSPRLGSLAELALHELEVPENLWNERPNRISSEVRKKVLLARAIVLNPAVLILDDPSAMVSSQFTKFLLRWIIKQKKLVRAVLIGTEDYPLGIALADWCIHPSTGEKTTAYHSFIEPYWIENANNLRNGILGTCS